MISLLVPFRDDASDRSRNWKWLNQYWTHELPDAEIVIGHYDGVPFSKTAAVNDAAKRAMGDIFVILDADCYLDGSVLTECTRRIKEAEARDRALWFVPYRHFHRLPIEPTLKVLESDPEDPLRFAIPYLVDDGLGSGVAGHHYGALVIILSRRAFFQAGEMDEHYVGWGGEDVSFMFAVDTLYGRHQTTDNDVFHLFHEGIGDSWTTRQWSGQVGHMPYQHRVLKYSAARFDLAKMRALVDEDLR